ncbi:DUF2922 domain-containing protein [Candidatus Desulforudis audaxviator]|uniref:DUF2922 domain-containing protein n=1 Tax=Desulforudis audaxviator (strain MP104C) TaxID=477974 RepID=B1I5B7_DESAP|nr:DUF2922 domain-containing protein [Candidatus Desulforudis audaxviator]ACA60168.1 conserved hypothetical protein [Candidatus Desulforudis audaxviator MP104C]AZK60207.1 hypothetical protein Daudx_1664 [Candidatus Desulforudis audaxviator]
MDVVRTLELRFANEAGRTVTIRVAEPRENLTAAEIEAAMNAIVDADVFISAGGDLVEPVGARLVAREVTEYEFGA